MEIQIAAMFQTTNQSTNITVNQYSTSYPKNLTKRYPNATHQILGLLKLSLRQDSGQPSLPVALMDREVWNAPGLGKSDDHFTVCYMEHVPFSLIWLTYLLKLLLFNSYVKYINILLNYQRDPERKSNGYVYLAELFHNWPIWTVWPFDDDSPVLSLNHDLWLHRSEVVTIQPGLLYSLWYVLFWICRYILGPYSSTILPNGGQMDPTSEVLWEQPVFQEG